MFRDQQQAMDTALQELADRHPVGAKVSTKEDLVAASRPVEHPPLPKSSFTTGAMTNFVFFPHTPVSAVEVQQPAKLQGPGRITGEPNQGSIITEGQSDHTFWINSSRNDGSFLDSRAEHDNSVATDTMAMDLEFDWNRWDEMFGQNPLGFEDMMMDLASTELQHEGSGHGDP